MPIRLQQIIVMAIAHEILRHDPASVAFVEVGRNGSSLTYGDVAKLARAIAREIRLRDFSSTQRLAVLTPRGPDGLLMFLAVSSRAVCCPLDPRLLDDELASSLRDLGAVAVIDATGEHASQMSLPRLLFRYEA